MRNKEQRFETGPRFCSNTGFHLLLMELRLLFMYNPFIFISLSKIDVFQIRTYVLNNVKLRGYACNLEI